MCVCVCAFQHIEWMWVDDDDYVDGGGVALKGGRDAEMINSIQNIIPVALHLA